MDNLSILIIVISVVLALAFKIFLYNRIRQWMDNDLIRGLADGNQQKLDFLTDQYQQLKNTNTKRKEYHSKLTALAEQFDRTEPKIPTK